MYAMEFTKSDIAHAVGVVSRYMSSLGKQRLEVVNWILRYLRGTGDSVLCFKKSDLSLQGYVNAYMAGHW